jgi:hypothetical protein
LSGVRVVPYGRCIRAEQHLCSRNLWQKNEQVRRYISNLTKRKVCHNKVRAGRRKPGVRAEMPIHSLHGQRGSERSVGWSVALRPCGPDARPQTRLPGRSNKSPGSRRRCLVDGRNPEVQGLVDEASCLKGVWKGAQAKSTKAGK